MNKSDYNRQYYLKNRQQMLSDAASYREANRATINAKAVERYQRVRERILIQSKEYNSRPEVKAHRKQYNSEYHRRNKNRLSAAHKEYVEKNRGSINASNRAYWKKHPEKLRLWQRRWAKNNPAKLKAYDSRRRAAELNATIDPVAAQWFYEVVHNQDVLTCAYCYTTVDAKNAHVDHVIPISRGGEHGPNNFCVACSSCNQSKCDRLLEEWPRLPERVRPLLATI